MVRVLTGTFLLPDVGSVDWLKQNGETKSYSISIAWWVVFCFLFFFKLDLY